MAERVIDRFKAVEVQTKQSEALAGLLEALLDMCTQLNAICQSGQCIVMGQEGNLPLRISLLGHIHMNRNPASCAQWRADNRNGAPIVQFLLRNSCWRRS